MEFVILFAVIAGIVFFVFSSAYSSIPFLPTHSRDLTTVIKKLNLKKDQVIIDLGAGSGTVIFAAATEAHKKGLNTEFIAIDINFLLVIFMWMRSWFHPHRNHITVLQGDLFKMDYERMIEPYQNILFYMYVSPWVTDTLAELIQETKKPVSLLSYRYPVKKMKPIETAGGEHKLYSYEINY
ncbi:hypothetical protein IPM65_04165 [Candidatus Roizmanbacteria bacterium]|nr:MAG: hypothetical protein IPM65_04165 [Candidatus Roizmanbacteria bacterium]